MGGAAGRIAEHWGNQGKVPPLWLLSGFIFFAFFRHTHAALGMQTELSFANVTWPQGLGEGQRGKCSGARDIYSGAQIFRRRLEVALAG